MTWTPSIGNCDAYLGERTGSYEQRAVRYRHAAQAMVGAGLDDTMTVVDIGAGWTEFDYCLRAEFGFKGRYIPVDGGIDGTDLNFWRPVRTADWFVALEILEHVHQPARLAREMQASAKRGVVFSTPNPMTTDVLGMDPTHVAEIDADDARSWGFTVSEETFYGGVFSHGHPDSLFGHWEV